MTTSLSISVSTSDLLSKIRRNLSVVAKRAKKADGSPMYSDLTTSTSEEVIFNDLLMFGAETIVSELSELASGYAEQNGSSISFTLYSERWCKSASPDMDITEALKGLISNYLYNFCLARYLSEIHPSTGDKYPPIFGKTYTDHCAMIIQNIKKIAFLKRDAKKSSCGYGSITTS